MLDMLLKANGINVEEMKEQIASFAHGVVTRQQRTESELAWIRKALEAIAIAQGVQLETPAQLTHEHEEVNDDGERDAG